MSSTIQPSHTSATEIKKKRKAETQAAYRARHAKYISALEKTVAHLESMSSLLQYRWEKAENEAEGFQRENFKLKEALELKQRVSSKRGRGLETKVLSYVPPPSPSFLTRDFTRLASPHSSVSLPCPFDHSHPACSLTHPRSELSPTRSMSCHHLTYASSLATPYDAHPLLSFTDKNIHIPQESSDRRRRFNDCVARLDIHRGVSDTKAGSLRSNTDANRSTASECSSWRSSHSYSNKYETFPLHTVAPTPHDRSPESDIVFSSGLLDVIRNSAFGSTKRRKVEIFRADSPKQPMQEMTEDNEYLLRSQHS
ncbi:hypothetical protein GG344DRAFT_81234 [Lentinula edodes]|nr:hypothetical protein GG344DRAFT_81234 [Lentinula edodes]